MSLLLDKINKVEYNTKQWQNKDSAIPGPPGLRSPRAGGSMKTEKQGSSRKERIPCGHSKFKTHRVVTSTRPVIGDG